MRNTHQTSPVRRMDRRKKLLLQKLLGLSLLAAAVLAARMCSTGPSMTDRDASGAVLIALLGLWLLFTRKTIID